MLVEHHSNRLMAHHYKSAVLVPLLRHKKGKQGRNQNHNSWSSSVVTALATEARDPGFDSFAPLSHLIPSHALFIDKML